MDRYIFVSYSHQDQRIVSSIADRLERSGYSIWYDRDIQPGSLWDDTIKNRLKDSSVVLLFISSHFVRSDYCLLELKLALEQKKPIVPLYLDGAKFEEDLQRQIDRIQNIAISPTTYDECLQRLQKLDPIQKCLGKFSATRNWISNGNIITTTGTGSKSISVYRPDLFFVCTLCDRLKERGITIASPDSSKPIYGTGTLPTSKTVEFFCMTRSLGQLLNKTLKDSDNLYAESMLYLIANAKAGKWATAADARHAIDAIIKQAGESPSYSRVADGSGVSLYDYTTPRTLVAMLRFAYKDQNIFSNFYPALPIAGMDGTLNSRMTQGNAFGNVRAKTGTVSGVSCLAGYVTASNGNMLAFSILCNGCLKIANAKALQNKLCQELAR